MSQNLKNRLLDKLTPAERLVAVHLVEGLSNKEIAVVLGKAEATVKHQISAILRASNATGRCHFVALYYQQFFCPLPLGGAKNAQPRESIFAASRHAANRA